MKDKLKPIQLIHIALCIGVTIAYAILGDLLSLNFIEFPEIGGDSLIYLIVPLSALFIGNLVYKQQLKTADPRAKLEQKVGTYQTASIIRWAMLEGAAFFLLFLKKEFLLVGLVIILYMVFLRPSENNMKRDFEMYGK